MTFGPQHYVPVLKVKRAEKHALRTILNPVRQSITPLMEIVERADKEINAHLDTAFTGLSDSLQLYSRCFLDTRELEPDGPAAAAEVFSRASAAGIVFAPVTGISRSADVDAALSHRSNGMALRLTRSELEDGGLPRNLRRFMGQHSLAPEDIDLVIDLGPVDALVADGVAALTEAFLADVPDHGRWRTFTVSACAFPWSMGGIGRNSHELVERTEWIAWREGLYTRRHDLPRLPTFSDCAIQHPAGVEGFNPVTMQASATIRYTVPDAWLLIKGVGTRVTPPSIQFPALATQLVYGHLQSHFAGEDHCNGCASVKASADGAPSLGSLEVWRRLGTIHHVTTVVQEIAALPWP